MKDKLEVGMYVRTKWGIAKIIDKRDVSGSLHREEIVFILDNGNKLALHSQKVIKASFDVIDILEKGDYVNGHEVKSKQSGVKRIDIGEDENYVWLYEKDIKSVITHEQMEQMAYKVGD